MATRKREKLNGLGIADISINQPVFITMVMLSIIVFGVLAYRSTPVNLLPDFEVPVVAVTLAYPGAGPESVADTVVKPIEEAVNTIAGLDHITSNASEGIAVIVLEFAQGSDINLIDQDVREKVNGVVPTLPQDVRDPIFQRFDPNAAAIMSIAVSANNSQSPLALRQQIDDEIVPLLQRAQGIGAIDVNGGQERQINVYMDLAKLQAYGILPAQLTRSLQSANANLGLGSITSGNQEINLRAPSLLQSVDDIAKIQITGTSYRVGDVATVEDGVGETISYSRLDGNDAIILSVRKQSGTNTVQVADNTLAQLETVFANRSDLSYTIVTDDAQDVRDSVNSSLEEIFFATLAAFLVVWLFFGNLRSTFITMIGLPIILIGTFIFMPIFGITINLISLLALSLCVGLVIDDAIVVRENIFRHMERGESARVASSKGTSEVSLSVLAMTLTIVAVFVPVTFAEGTAGIVFKSFGIIVAIAILLSLVEAFTFAPMMSGNLFAGRSKVKHKPTAAEAHHAPTVEVHGDIDEGENDASLVHEANEDPGWMGRQYGRLLAWSLKSLLNRMAIVAIAVAVLIASGFVATGLKFSFFPEQDPHEFVMGFELDPGTALVENDRVAKQAEAIILADPDVETVISTIGFSGNSARSEFTVILKGKAPTLPTQERLRAQLPFLPRLAFSAPSFQGSSTAVTGRELQISLQTTRPLADIAPVVEATKAQMETVQGLVDIDSNYQTGKPELQFNADPARIGELGITNDDIASSVRALINGERATVLRQDGKDTDIIVRLRPEDRASTDSIRAISLPTPSGVVPLSALGQVTLSDTPTTVRRYDRLNQVIIGANLEGRNLAEAQAELNTKIASIGIPSAITLSYVGEVQQQTEGFDTLFIAMGLSVLLVYMVLASQFGSFTQPLVIMMAMPFSFIGAFLALRLTNIDLDITGMIGLIMLLGLVVKNSILLVDFANRLRRIGLEKHEALRLAGAIRLRPILMTTLALIAGSLPVAIGLHVFGSGEGSEFRRGLAVVLIGGLATSTVLTLLVVPTVYSLMESLTSRLSRLFSRDTDDEGAPAPRTPALAGAGGASGASSPSAPIVRSTADATDATAD